MKHRTHGSILDFPRKTLPGDLWIYDNKEDLPRLRPGLRNLIMKTAKKASNIHKLPLEDIRLIGGAASYQWSPGTDIDVQIFVEWPEGVDENKVLETRQTIYKIKDEYDLVRLAQVWDELRRP